MDLEIARSLQEIGLTKGETDVYLALLKFGLSTTGRITKEANIGSSKVYEVLQRLIAKGLASYVIENGVKHYSATPVERLIDHLENKKQQLTTGQETIRKLLPELQRQRNQTTQAESVIYRGKQGPLMMLKELIDIGKNGHEIVGFGTTEDDWDKEFPAQLRQFVSDSEKFNIKSRLIFGEGFTPANFTAKVRHLPNAFISPVRTVIAGNKVYIVDFTKPITTIVIEKEEIAQAYMKHFNMLWKQAKKSLS